MRQLCRDFMKGECARDNCKFVHNPKACFHFWKHGQCKFGDACQKEHIAGTGKGRGGKVKNTENFEPMTRPVDMRVVVDLNREKVATQIGSRDVLLAPNLFADFAPGEIYTKLVEEIETCGVESDKLLKLWHGDSHYIADDHTNWKDAVPTFAMVVERIRTYFDMDIQATRFNWYKDTSQWKPFHHDAAAIKPKQAATQNFTVAISFGATRDAAFEEVKSKVVVSMPQPDGCAYCFAKDTNILWKHGILQDKQIRNEGRISVIAWGWIHNMESVGEC